MPIGSTWVCPAPGSWTAPAPVVQVQVRRRVEQHRIQDAEQGAVGANPEREREHGSAVKPGLFRSRGTQSASHSGSSLSSFGPQSNDRVDAADRRGQITGQQGDADQQQCRAEERRRVGGVTSLVSRLFSARARSSAPPMPIRTPIRVSMMPCRRTRAMTSRTWAPSAIRIPISWVRWLTE